MVSQRILGSVLVILALSMLFSIYSYKKQVDTLTTLLMISSGGQCVQNGVCIHEQSNLPLYLGITLSTLLFALGVYLFIASKHQQQSTKAQQEMLKLLHQSKKKHTEDERFSLISKALDEDEKKVMNAVREQDGIEQSTLRIRTDLSKTKLSVVLSDLEKKNLVKKVPEGKKNRIYIKNAF